MSEVAPKSGEYQDGKLWFQRKGTTVTVGLTSVAIEEIGAVEGVELPDDGDDFDKGDVLGTAIGATGNLELIAPASGFVESVNEAAKDSPEMVSEDPFEQGWLVKLEIQDTSDLKEYAGGD